MTVDSKDIEIEGVTIELRNLEIIKKGEYEYEAYINGVAINGLLDLCDGHRLIEDVLDNWCDDIILAKMEPMDQVDED